MAKAKDGTVNKMDLVREALSDLGPAAKPAAIAEAIKAKSGVEVSKNIISAYKSMLKKRAGLGATRGRRGSATSVAPAGRGGSVSISDLEQVRDLVNRHGAEQLKKLIGVLR
jgi:hypothetical protein